MLELRAPSSSSSASTCSKKKKEDKDKGPSAKEREAERQAVHVKFLMGNRPPPMFTVPFIRDVRVPLIS